MGSQVQKLTHRQEMVLQYIQSSITERGYPPTLREIGNFMGIRSTNGVNDHLRALERKGYLTREDMKSRALRPTVFDIKPNGAGANGANGNGAGDGLGVSTAAIDDSFIEIPILGRVAAGQLTEAIQSPEDTVRIDRMLVGGASRDVFGLRVRGESMVNAGIRDGDYVFVRKQIDARKGEIIVALVGNLVSQDSAQLLVLFSPADILDGTNAWIYGSIPDNPIVASLDLPGVAYLAAAIAGIIGATALTVRRYMTIQI